MMQDRTDLAALIGSRICHDLISPIGAISNGLELLEMTGDASGPEMELISDSADHAGARIRFFRIAYGAADDQDIGRQEVSSVLRALNRGGRCQFQWGPTDPAPRNLVQLAFLALQCLESALPHGGEVQVQREGAEWTVRATDVSVQANPEHWQELARGKPCAGATAATVQFVLLPVLAQDLGRTLSARWSEREIVLQF